jgi:hypothetical protein
MTKISFVIITLISLTAFGCKSLKSVVDSKSNNLNVASVDLDKSVWIYHIASIQCETIFFNNRLAAIDFLNSNYIAVFESDEINSVTCTACGCPSGLRFIARIRYNDLEKAEKLGWSLLKDKRYLNGPIDN